MIVGDPISLYSEYYGWVFYGVIWDVLSATGLALVPLFIVVGRSLLEIREQGSSMGLQSDNVLAPVETKLFVLLIVLGLAVVPNAATTVTPLTFQFSQKADAYGTTAGIVNQGATNSTLNQITSPSAAAGAGVSVPPWWLLMTKISHGITHAVSQSVDTSGASIKAVKNMASTAHIANPSLRASIGDFVQSCYAPALRQFDDERKGDNTLAHNQGGAGGGGYTDADINGIDISKMNSQFFITTPRYYPSMTTTNLAPGTAPNAASTPEYTGAAIASRQSCLAFWNGIEAEILEEANLSGYIGVFDRMVATGRGALTAANRNELIIDTYLGRLSKAYKGQSDKIVAARSIGGGADQSTVVGAAAGVANLVGDTIDVYFLIKTAYMADLFADATIYTMTALRSMAMIVIIMALPIGMLISGYSLKFLVSGATLLFTLIFMTAIWDIASWAENELTVSLFPNAEDLMGFVAGVDSAEMIKKHLSLSIAGAALYLFLPGVFIWVMTAAGSSHLGRTSVPGTTGSLTGGAAAKSAFNTVAKGRGGRKKK